MKSIGTGIFPSGLPDEWVSRPSKQSIQLRQTQKTPLMPLYLRALESRRKRPVLRDPKAGEMVESIDGDSHPRS